MVHRVVRHVEVWSVAKVAAAFAACGYVIGMISGYLLWRAADRVGTIDGIEGFLEDSGGYDGGFQILGDVVFQAAAVGLAVLAMAFVALAVLGAVLFNLISDLTGGIRMTAIDEDLIVTPARRPRPDAATPAAPAAAPRPVDDDHDEVAAPAAAATPAHAASTTEPVRDDPAPTTTVPAAGPAHDPWKMPAPNETWTAPSTPASEPRNGSATDTPHADDESIGLGSGDRVV